MKHAVMNVGVTGRRLTCDSLIPHKSTDASVSLHYSGA